ncbi:hypothetical protein BH09ACT4_BH09ACT4_06850 [soil metagenome]
MADDKHDTIDKSETPVLKRRTARSTPILGIVLGLVGAALMSYGFVNGISAALDGSNGNTTPFLVMFFAGGGLALIAAVIGLVGLVRGGHRILSFFSLAIGLLPLVFIVFLRIANQ